MNTIQWLLVDIGDVLLLKQRDDSFTQLLADELGVDFALAQEINKAHYTTMDIRDVPEEEFVAGLKEELGYTAPEGIYAYFARAYEKQVRPNTELLDFLNEVRKAGIKTAVLSNTIALYQQIQEEAGISKQAGFDPIIYSWEVGLIKPDRAIYELALERLHAKPEEVIFIDDKAGHLEGARAIGIRTVLFESDESAAAQLRTILAMK